jgi:glycosyltransferase involved in cell wall biosynthesis
MRIGVVTPAYNVAPYIGAAIDSVLAQTHRDWTMTIVDDGSSDATAAVAASVHDARVRLIGQPNGGVSAARNRGLAATQADAVLFLDADDWLSPEAMRDLAAALRADPGAVAAVGAYRRVSLAGTNFGGVVRPASGDLLGALLIGNLFANGGHLLVRSEAVDEAGAFHTGLRYGEDWEYWVRLAGLGRFTAVPGRAPLLFVRERQGGAYFSMAASPQSFVPCMNAIFDAAAVRERFGAADLARLRRRAEAENDWIVGRELVRHGRWWEGRPFLSRSVRNAPGLKRAVLLAAGSLPMFGIGPFRRYRRDGPDSGS